MMVMGLITALVELGMAVALVPIKMSTKGVQLAQSIIDGDEIARMTDAQYCRYRIQHPIKRLLRESSREFVVETIDGHKEKWSKPKWTAPEWTIIESKITA